MQNRSKFLIIALSFVCGLLIGGILLAVNYDFGIMCSCGLAGGMIYALVKRRTSGTGLGRVFGFISGVVGIFIYRMIMVVLFLDISVYVFLIAYFLPYILTACGFIVQEKQKNKPESSAQTVLEHKEVTTIPKVTTVDPLFIDAGRMIIEKNRVSTSMLQRVYQIDFKRASAIIEQLCIAGVISAQNGNGSREILMSVQMFDDYLKVKGYL